MLAMIRLPFLIFILKSNCLTADGTGLLSGRMRQLRRSDSERALSLLNGEARWITCASASHFVAGRDECKSLIRKLLYQRFGRMHGTGRTDMKRGDVVGIDPLPAVDM